MSCVVPGPGTKAAVTLCHVPAGERGDGDDALKEAASCIVVWEPEGELRPSVLVGYLPRCHGTSL